MRVTGIVRDIEDISDAPEPYFMPSSGFLDRWGDDVAHLTGTALVNTDPAASRRWWRQSQDAVGPYFAVAPAVEQDNFAKRVRDTIDVEVTVLGVFAVAAGLTGLLVIGQALARQRWQLDDGPADAERDSASTGDVRSSPPPRPSRRRSSSGALGAVPLAVGVSSLFPRGLARAGGPGPGPVGGRAGGRPRRGPRAADRGDADALDELAHRSGWCPDRASARPALRGRRPPGRFRARRARARGPLRAGARPSPRTGRRPGRDRGRRGARRRARRRRHHRTLPRPPPGRVPPVRRRLGPGDGLLRGRRPAGRPRAARERPRRRRGGHPLEPPGRRRRGRGAERPGPLGGRTDGLRVVQGFPAAGGVGGTAAGHRRDRHRHRAGGPAARRHRRHRRRRGTRRRCRPAGHRLAREPRHRRARRRARRHAGHARGHAGA